jgi:hypothetical protein
VGVDAESGILSPSIDVDGEVFFDAQRMIQFVCD